MAERKDRSKGPDKARSREIPLIAPTFEISLTTDQLKALSNHSSALQLDRNRLSNLRDSDLKTEAGKVVYGSGRQGLDSVAIPVFNIVNDFSRSGDAVRVGIIDTEGVLKYSFKEETGFLTNLYTFPGRNLRELFKTIGIGYESEEQRIDFERKYRNGIPIIFTQAPSTAKNSAKS